MRLLMLTTVLKGIAFVLYIIIITVLNAMGASSVFHI